MQTYLIELSYDGVIELPPIGPDRDNALKKNILEAIATQSVVMADYNPTEIKEFDHVEDYSDHITETSTIIEFLIDVADDELDMHDGGDDIYHYMVDVLELRPVHIAYAWQKEHGALRKTVIGLTSLQHDL